MSKVTMIWKGTHLLLFERLNFFGVAPAPITSCLFTDFEDACTLTFHQMTLWKVHRHQKRIHAALFTINLGLFNVCSLKIFPNLRIHSWLRPEVFFEMPDVRCLTNSMLPMMIKANQLKASLWELIWCQNHCHFAFWMNKIMCASLLRGCLWHRTE